MKAMMSVFHTAVESAYMVDAWHQTNANVSRVGEEETALVLVTPTYGDPDVTIPVLA